jgi:xanthine dehydrogenase accessory factor
MWRQGGLSALATLVKTKGSSYRRPGARLLLGVQGEYARTISGVCLEAEVVRKAAWLVRQGAFRLAITV